MNILVSIIVVTGLLFGGGATVSAAQDDLPGQPLYAVKTASEDISLQFRNTPEEKVARLMELAQIRIQEMTALTEAGQTPPEAVAARLEQHIQMALQTCAKMEDAALDQTLLQIRDQLRQQDRDMEQLQLHASSDALPLLERTRTMLQLRLQLVDDGLLNREQFRHTVRNGFNFGQNVTPVVTPVGTQNQNQNQNQNGQPTSAPGGPNTDPGGPNDNPGGPNYDSTPGSNNDNESGSGNGSGSGPDNGSGGSGSGGSGSGGNGNGGKK
ncbi:MAG: hypothetical protein HXY35_15110 [Chloroflexi bacterium]|nr:hypothetical protein [Chloroflexota bacterium]